MIITLNLKVEVFPEAGVSSFDCERAVATILHGGAESLADRLNEESDGYTVVPTHTVDLVINPCPCGSGLESDWEFDARGIELGRMCDKCREERLSHYRPEVLADSSYEADEPIEEE